VHRVVFSPGGGVCLVLVGGGGKGDGGTGGLLAHGGRRVGGLYMSPC